MRSLRNSTGFVKSLFLSLVFSVFLQASVTHAEVISTAAELLEIDGNSGTFTLGRNIELLPAEEGNAAYISTFSGTLEGVGYTISGLTRPLFHSLVLGSSVSILELVAHSDGVIGQGILANLSSGDIVNVNVVGDLTGSLDNVGGLVGASEGFITGSSVTGDIAGAGDYVGGLVGLSLGSILESSATGQVDGNAFVGGLTGYSVGEISDSSASGDVNGNSNYVGGLAGYSVGEISSSSASGDVNGTSGYVGGLVGETTN